MSDERTKSPLSRTRSKNKCVDCGFCGENYPVALVRTSALTFGTHRRPARICRGCVAEYAQANREAEEREQQARLIAQQLSGQPS